MIKRKKEKVAKNGRKKKGKGISDQKLRGLLRGMFVAFPELQKIFLWDRLKNLATKPQSVPGLTWDITDNGDMTHPIFWLTLLVHHGTVSKDRSLEGGEKVAKFLRQISGMVQGFIFSHPWVVHPGFWEASRPQVPKRKR